ncbi:Glutamate decarboxylase [Capsicum baccatum]|uniref:glutamate decarboxylase n=1 Tax=Capsicum baccatum TaxID=33114 RepID=A0A2G2W0G1_CAPBA|nr:Glutamate decarboxylase [Capsicum baccatum]
MWYRSVGKNLQAPKRAPYKKNKEIGWDTSIHVDAASGGFIAPFLWPNLEWNFRLPLVKSINVSGHKYDLVYAGVGWVIWRSKDDLPDELVFHINYLGSDQPTFTLNFSKGSYQIIDPKFYFLTIKKASRLMNKFGSWPRISCHANTIYVISEFGTVYTIYVDIFE